MGGGIAAIDIELAVPGISATEGGKFEELFPQKFKYTPARQLSSHKRTARPGKVLRE